MEINKSNIIDMRKTQGWSQEDLAAASGLSVRTIQRLESQGTGSLDSAKAVAAAFDVELDVLRKPKLRLAHFHFIWKPILLWLLGVSVVVVISTELTVRGVITDVGGACFVVGTTIGFMAMGLIFILRRFYDEFGPFWKQWEV